MLMCEQMAIRVACELHDDYYVNLGIGIPTLVTNYIPDGMDVMLQSESGLLGMGPSPTEDKIDVDIISAGKQTAMTCKGAAISDSAQSFAMTRDGHVDLTVLGAFEVDISDNIASWTIPGKIVEGMGGIMDLVAGVESIIVIVTHVPKSDESKLLSACALPPTGVACIKRVPTNLALLEIANGASIPREHAPGISADGIVARTAGKLIVPENAPEM